jgi:hypothetical protein
VKFSTIFWVSLAYGELDLSVASVQDHVVLPVLHAVAVGTTPGEDLEASSDTSRVVAAEVVERWPVHVALVRADLGDLVFIALDAPEGADVVSVQPALGLVVGVHLGVDESQRCGGDSVGDRLHDSHLPSRRSFFII